MVAFSVAIGACTLDKSGLSQVENTPVGTTGGSGGAVSGGGGAGAGSAGGATGEGGAGGTAMHDAGASGGSGGKVTGTGGTAGTGGVGGDGSVGGTGGGAAGAGGAGGTAGTGGTGGGAGGAGGTQVVSPIGCSDGTREAFTNMTNFPNIAACAGGWSVAGVLTTASMTPACGRAAGNSGTNTSGNGCTVEDLCADGWHVCEGATELSNLNVRCSQAGIPPLTTVASRVFYVTRQHGGAGNTGCTANDTTGVNNIHGCGNFGLTEVAACAPLDDQMSHNECDMLAMWSCSDAVMPNNTADEALVVTKVGSTGGGVLCCRTPGN